VNINGGSIKAARNPGPKLDLKFHSAETGAKKGAGEPRHGTDNAKQLARARRRIRELEIALSASKLENLRLSNDTTRMHEMGSSYYSARGFADTDENTMVRSESELSQTCLPPSRGCSRGFEKEGKRAWIADHTLEDLRESALRSTRSESTTSRDRSKLKTPGTQLTTGITGRLASNSVQTPSTAPHSGAEDSVVRSTGKGGLEVESDVRNTKGSAGGSMNLRLLIKLHKMILSLRKILTLEVNAKQIWEDVLTLAGRLLGAKHVVLYEFDDEDDKFSAIASNSQLRTRYSFSMGEGPVGSSAEKKLICNIYDLRKDPRFPKSRTFASMPVRAMLCIPVTSTIFPEQGTMYVLQFIEKANTIGPNNFSEEDEVIGEIISSYITSVREQLYLRQRIRDQQSKTTGFFDSVEKLFAGDELVQAALNIVKKTRTLFDASYSLLFRVDKEAKELVLIAQSSDEPLFIPQGYANRRQYKGMTSQRVPLSTSSLATMAALSETQINVKDSKTDSRFNVQADEYLAASKYQLGQWGTGAVLVTPIMDTKDTQNICGVHILARTRRKPFTKADEIEIKGFLDLMAICINRICMTEDGSSGVDENVMSLKDLLDNFPKEERLPELAPLAEQVQKLQQIKSDYHNLLDPEK